jgi:DNA modification methylase
MPRLRQRADLTHKHNHKTGRHGWLRLTPAYSVKIVEDLIENCEQPMRIFDPFCGTATTALIAAYHGHEGVTTDINPFLVWLGKAKTAHYSAKEIASTRHACTRALGMVQGKGAGSVISYPPQIHNIERWWSPAALKFLCAVKGALEAVTVEGSAEHTLLLIAFCRTLIGLSNAAFNHQSMSFKDDGQFHLNLDIDMSALYAQDVDFVLSGARNNPEGEGQVLLGDSRSVAAFLEGKFDRVITSPPYANRMSYIRELRPYMYWLGFLTTGRDAGELDWSAIGGTWGIATSRLAEWKPTPGEFESKMLASALDRIAHQDNKSGSILSNYVAKYFDDMWAHFCGLTPVVAARAEIHYIVGNSTFYGVLLPTEKIYAEMLSALGFTKVECRAIRKRNSKKELIEFDVTATWPS